MVDSDRHRMRCFFDRDGCPKPFALGKDRYLHKVTGLNLVIYDAWLQNITWILFFQTFFIMWFVNVSITFTHNNDAEK